MFNFDRWGDWLERRASELNGDTLSATFFDGRDVPELELNPSYGIHASAGGAVGRIQFWRGGTCDYEFWNGTDDEPILAMMLEASDETVVPLTDRFVSFFRPDGR